MSCVDSEVTSSVEKPSDSQRDRILVPESHESCQQKAKCREAEEGKQKQCEPTYPVFGLHME